MILSFTQLVFYYWYANDFFAQRICVFLGWRTSISQFPYMLLSPIMMHETCLLAETSFNFQDSQKDFSNRSVEATHIYTEEEFEQIEAIQLAKRIGPTKGQKRVAEVEEEK